MKMNLLKTRANDTEYSKFKMTSADLSEDLSTSCPLFSPEAPTDVIDVLSKKESYDPLAENFQRQNKFGETVLYEATTEIVRIAIFAYANYDESCELIGPGKIAIVFYPNIGEIRVILQATCHLWPIRNVRIEENQNFDYDGWFWRDDGRNRMCKRREDLAPFEKERGLVFGDWNYYGVAFSNEAEIINLKNTIQSIQVRISKNQIPKDNDHKDQDSLRIMRFWCCTGLRASDFRVVCIHIGSVWRINGSYSVEHDKNGMIALASKIENPGVLEMLIIFQTRNGDEVEDVRKFYRVPASLGLVVSHITPENKKDLVWEWNIGGDLWACAFKSSEEAESFKEIVDLYVSDLKKSKKKLFGKK